MKTIIKTLNDARKAYYQENREIMSDFDYDKLSLELEKIEKKTGIVLSNSPNIQVGYTVMGELPKISHNTKMLSLDKTKSIGEMKTFLGQNEAILSFKMDGITIVLEYENGKFKTAVTRGNGLIGENITHNFKMFSGVPLEIPYKENIIIRGEALISFEVFNKINETLPSDQKYKNPRNLCSGSVRQLNNEITHSRNIEFLAFSLIESGKNFKTKIEQLKFLTEIGFNVVKHAIVDVQNIEESVKSFQDDIKNNKFTTDGLVVTFNDIEYSKSLGETSKFPKDSLAFKWRDDLIKTTFRNVEWNTSRTGLINPVAIFDPVELEGTTVSRASIHNLSIIKGLKLGIGDTISVYKANMIIPQIGENHTNSDTLIIPEKCGACGENAVQVSIRDGLALKCINTKCNARILHGITHYVSRDAMNIDDFSKATIEKFIDNGFLKDYTDIYFIDKYKNEIINMKGFGEKSYTNLLSAIEKSKNVSLANFIYGLGIDHIGLSNAKIMTKIFNYNFDEIKKAEVETLTNIEGFGEIIAQSVVQYFSKNENIEMINKVLPFLVIKKEKISLNQLLNNKTFVITGKVEKFKNRKQLQKKIEELNGKVSSSISANTDYLINNDKNSNSAKNKRAKELGINIIDENEFLNMINSSN